MGIFFQHTPVFFTRITSMNFQKKRFYFEVDEASWIRLQFVVGKQNIQQADFQRAVHALISCSYQNHKKIS